MPKPLPTTYRLSPKSDDSPKDQDEPEIVSDLDKIVTSAIKQVRMRLPQDSIISGVRFKDAQNDVGTVVFSAMGQTREMKLEDIPAVGGELKSFAPPVRVDAGTWVTLKVMCTKPGTLEGASTVRARDCQVSAELVGPSDDPTVPDGGDRVSPSPSDDDEKIDLPVNPDINTDVSSPDESFGESPGESIDPTSVGGSSSDSDNESPREAAVE